MKRWITYSLLAVSILAFSCQSEIYHTRSVVNHTDHEIVMVFENDYQERDTVVLMSQMTTVISHAYFPDTDQGSMPCALGAGSYFQLYVDDSEAVLSFDVRAARNWESTLDGKRSVDQQCYFVIEDEDLTILPN